MASLRKTKRSPDAFFTTTSGASSVNVVVQTDGTIRPRKGYKTFAGMVWQLRLINKRYNKMGVVGDFTVRLPLPMKGK